MIHSYWTKQKNDKKIVFFLTVLSCLILYACYDEDYRHTCKATLLPFQTSLPFNPHCIGDPSEGMSLISDGGTYTVRDTGLTSEGKWGYANLNNEIVVRPQYDRANDFAEGLASVGLNNRSGFIDKTGKIVIPLQFSETFSFSEGLAAAKLNGNWGYIDKTSKVIIPFQFTEGLSFSEGLAAAKLNNKWGYIDKSGNVIIPFKYDYTRRAKNGNIVVDIGIGGEGEFFDKTGKPIGK